MKCYQQICLILAFVLMQDTGVSADAVCSYDNVDYHVGDILYFPDNCIKLVCSYNYRTGVLMDFQTIDYCYCLDTSQGDRIKREAVEHRVNSSLGYYKKGSKGSQQPIKRNRRSRDIEVDYYEPVCIYNHRAYPIDSIIRSDHHQCLNLFCFDNMPSPLVVLTVMEECHCDMRGGCEQDPCYNDGRCIPDTYETFTCICLRGFEGEFCEDEIDECASTPCLNGASCTDLIDDFKCSCVAGFEGEICEINIDDCIDDPCGLGGNCTDYVNGHVCQCFGFTGSNCFENGYVINNASLNASSLYLNYWIEFAAKNWADAEEDCYSSGGKLVAPPTLTEALEILEPLKETLVQHTGIWIGGMANDQTEAVEDTEGNVMSSYPYNPHIGACIKLQYISNENELQNEDCLNALPYFCMKYYS